MFASNHRYGVRSTIYNVKNEQLWTSNTTTPYDPAMGSANIRTIVLVRTGGD